jgi:hypothetical protein
MMGGVDSGSKPLTCCPACASRLIYPLSFLPHDSGRVVIDRRCPECEHLDCVACDPQAAAIWARREQRLRLELVHAVLDLEIAAALA